MTLKPRVILFVCSVVVFVAILGLALVQLHPVGKATGTAAIYGDRINALSVPTRHITDAVTAVNFDFRGFDTLGEEFIMFASVLGVILLLRKHPGEEEQAPSDVERSRRMPPPSDAIRILTLALIGPVVVFGIYIVVHGQITPGGGFQGGVILANAPLLVYLAGEFESLLAVAPHWLVDTAEGIGAGGYVVVGAVPLVTAAAFLYNFLPLGQPKDVFSGGTVAVIDLAVGLEVAGGFIALFLAFLEETLVLRDTV